MSAPPPEKQDIDFSTLNVARLAHNFLNTSKAGNYTIDELNSHNAYLSYILDKNNRDLKKFKVGLMFVCINFPYWQYMKPVIDGVKNLFLPGHDVEIMLWSDVQNLPENKDVNYGATVFPVESIEWPYPTLMRYKYFLSQKEYLKKFDYLFYLDLDMRIVGIVGDEILPKDGLMAAPHPMYWFDKKFYPPYEPNPDSKAYIERPGRVVEEDGKKRFRPEYYAGGFQGGRTEPFIEAMEEMQQNIHADLSKNYIPIWNDESIWNKYLSTRTPEVMLDPSYIYPDSMIQEYYKPIWGRDYPPKIITLTKPFSTSKEGGAGANAMMNQLKDLK